MGTTRWIQEKMESGYNTIKDVVTNHPKATAFALITFPIFPSVSITFTTICAFQKFLNKHPEFSFTQKLIAHLSVATGMLTTCGLLTIPTKEYNEQFNHNMATKFIGANIMLGLNSLVIPTITFMGANLAKKLSPTTGKDSEERKALQPV